MNSETIVKGTFLCRKCLSINSQIYIIILPFVIGYLVSKRITLYLGLAVVVE